MSQPYKKSKKMYYVIIFSLSMVPIIVSAILFLVMGQQITENEWLMYIGSVFGYYGAIFLGIIAMYQNLKAYEQNEKIIYFQNENIKRPFFIIKRVYAEEFDDNAQKQDFDYRGEDWKKLISIQSEGKICGNIILENIGDGVAIDVEYSTEPETSICSAPCHTVTVGEDYHLMVELIDYEDYYFYHIELKYKNILNCRYKQIITISGDRLINLNDEKKTCAPNYRIIVSSYGGQVNSIDLD